MAFILASSVQLN